MDRTIIRFVTSLGNCYVPYRCVRANTGFKRDADVSGSLVLQGLGRTVGIPDGTQGWMWFS